MNFVDGSLDRDVYPRRKRLGQYSFLISAIPPRPISVPNNRFPNLQEHPEWIPESDDPRFDRFRPKPPIEAHPLWKDNSAYTFDDDTKLTGRMEQAKILTKTVIVEGLTADVEV